MDTDWKKRNEDFANLRLEIHNKEIKENEE
jgi:hypothetical protein